MSVHLRNKDSEEDKVPDAILRPGTDYLRPLGRIGPLETRLAASESEIAAAQSVRFQVFAEEMGASMSPENIRQRRDMDAFDEICDHLLVLDTDIDGDPEEQVVGTYRLLRGSVARSHQGFYSASEFNIDELTSRHPEKEFMELGRSCVLPRYRTRRTLEVLWQGNWAYALRHGVDVMFGCASFSGIYPEAHALALSFLHHNFSAKEPDWSVSALSGLHRSMDLMPQEAINPRRALAMMPPLVKGYLRLGAMVGNGAFVDHSFRTTDVMIVLPIANINRRYVNYYGADARRFA